jgi:RNA-splicing ligase RtcB
MEIIDNIPVWGAPVDEGALRQIKTCYYIFGQAAMMADHHKGYGVPIGGVIAHETLVSPSGVGYDHEAVGSWISGVVKSGVTSTHDREVAGSNPAVPKRDVAQW